MSNANNTTLGDIVMEKPYLAKMFEKLGIDYCCGGKRSLETACKESGLDPTTVLKMISAYSEEDTGTRFLNVQSMSLTELVKHIETTHHAYMRKSLPRLKDLFEKVIAAHGERHSELNDLRAVFERMAEEISSHLFKEEQVLFPAIRELESSTGPVEFHCGTLGNPIRVMEMEHDAAGAALAEMSRLTNQYTPPSDACSTYATLLNGLKDLEEDLHQHVHKENNVLFPRVIAREDEIRAS